MRLGTLAVVVSLSFASIAAQAGQSPQLEKLKTGIMPAGGFYTIYAVACGDKASSNIVSTQRRTRWCTNYDGQLNCFRSAKEASSLACASGSVADAAPIPLIR
jgi:hypothetical protein